MSGFEPDCPVSWLLKQYGTFLQFLGISHVFCSLWQVNTHLKKLNANCKSICSCFLGKKIPFMKTTTEDGWRQKMVEDC